MSGPSCATAAATAPPGLGASTSRRRGTRGPAFQVSESLETEFQGFDFQGLVFKDSKSRTRSQGFDLRFSISRIRSPREKFDLKDSSVTARSSRPLRPPRRPAPAAARPPRGLAPAGTACRHARRGPGAPACALDGEDAVGRPAAGVRRLQYPHDGHRAPGRYGRTGGRDQGGRPRFPRSRSFFRVPTFGGLDSYVLDMFYLLYDRSTRELAHADA
jgi:hypothetical protein